MNRFHKPSSQPFALVLLKEIDITQISESRVIRYQACKPYLGFMVINTKVKAVGD